MLIAAGCAQSVTGQAVRSAPGIDDDSHSPVDVDTLILDPPQMRAITGAGDDLTIIPTMDAKVPVDVEELAKTADPQCEWIFAETLTFGPEVEEFRKTTFQHPARGGLISEAVAGYRDTATARRAFGALVARIGDCATTTYGRMLLGEWTGTPDAVSTRSHGGCGRDYQVRDVVLAEVTFCAFPDSVPGIVLANILAGLPAG